MDAYIIFFKPQFVNISGEQITLEDLKTMTRNDVDHVMREFKFSDKKLFYQFIENFNNENNVSIFLNLFFTFPDLG